MRARRGHPTRRTASTPTGERSPRSEASGAAAGEVGLGGEVRPVTEAELRAADEVWLTSSTREVQAIVTLDGRPVGNGRPGPLFRQMYGWYQDYKERVMRAPAAA